MIDIQELRELKELVKTLKKQINDLDKKANKIIHLWEKTMMDDWK